MFLRNIQPESNQEIRVAYVIFAHGRSVRQIIRLIQRIYRKEDYIYVHVDLRNEFLYDELKYLDFEENIRITDKRFATIWAGTSLMDAQLSAMKEMFELNWKMDFVTTLSGTDYVLRKTEDFKRYLGKYRGINFVKSAKLVIKANVDGNYGSMFYSLDYYTFLILSFFHSQIINVHFVNVMNTFSYLVQDLYLLELTIMKVQIGILYHGTSLSICYFIKMIQYYLDYTLSTIILCYQQKGFICLH